VEDMHDDLSLLCSDKTLENVRIIKKKGRWKSFRRGRERKIYMIKKELATYSR
jgi:hypothetical protein